MAVERIKMTFKNISNFRDFGGYQTKEGQTVKTGYLFRSDALCHIDHEEAEIIAEKYHVKTIIDFRSVVERESEPDKLVKGTTVFAIAPEAKLAEFASEATDQKAQKRKSSVELIKEGKTDQFLTISEDMQRMMQSFVTNEKNRAAFRRMLEVYLNPENYAILQHCRGGKDRTGFGAALILGILGVPKEVIMKDYLLSNAYNAQVIEKKMTMYRSITQDKKLLENLLDMLVVKENYLNAAYDEMDHEYGGFDRFVSEGVGFNLEQQEKLKRILLV
jgi:protein-tyrosine phosphatase